MPGERLYNFAAARTAEQLAEMRRLDDLGICAFCPDGLAETGQEAIGESHPHWLVIANRWPYPGAAEHWLIVSRQHITSLDEVIGSSWDAWIDLGIAISRAAAGHPCEVRVRSGDMAVSGATVAHLHWHVIVPAVSESPAP